MEQATNRKPKRERLPKKLKPFPKDIGTMWESQGIRRRGHGKQEGKGTGRGQVLWQASKLVLKTGKHFPGRNSSGTSSASKSAFTKPKSVATSNVFAACNGYCFALFQRDAWQYDRYHKTTGGKRHPEWTG